MITNGDFNLGSAPKKKNAKKRAAALTVDAWRDDLEGRRFAKTLTPFAGKTEGRAVDAEKRQRAARGGLVDSKRAVAATAPRKNDAGNAKSAARLAALEDLTSELKNARTSKKKNDMDAKRLDRLYDGADRQREARAAIVDSKRKKNTAPVPAKRKAAAKAPVPAKRKAAAENSSRRKSDRRRDKEAI
jgi:hypothetical protein